MSRDAPSARPEREAAQGRGRPASKSLDECAPAWVAGRWTSGFFGGVIGVERRAPEVVIVRLARSIVVACLLGVGFGGTVAGASMPAARGELLFVTLVQATGPTGVSLSLELRAVSADGGSARTLLSGLPEGYWVEFSPDRRSFAFISKSELLIVRVDGSGRKTVARPVAQYAWSASGTRLAYVSAGRQSQIYTIRIDGSGRRRLTTSTRRRTGQVHPFHTLAWSRDGRRIAFTSQTADWKGRPLTGRLFTITADGREQKRLTGLGSFVPEELAWSPARQELAVGGVVDSGVLLLRRDRQSKPVTVAGTRCCMGVGASWSPDGTRLAFLGGDTSAGYAGGVAQPRTSGSTIFTQFAGGVHNPAWSPDGTELAFVGCNDQGACSIYASDRNGHHIARILSERVRFVEALAWVR